MPGQSLRGGMQVLKVNEVAKLAGVTVRALHYYDEIGLLSPAEITDSGYRLYDDTALEKLQQILFFRELDFSLDEIRKIMQSPNYDRHEALKKQKELLLKKRQRLDRLIELIQKTIKGDAEMSFKEFDTSEIEEHKRKYAEEVRERWGNTDAYRESEKKTASYTAEQWKALGSEAADIFRGFAEIRHLEPESEKAQALVKKWQDHITAYYYTCTKEILSGLGAMYTCDERFRKNIDAYGEGTAEFMSKAIAVYCAE
jgi:DNA-binding transcriptional MerR regulator